MNNRVSISLIIDDDKLYNGFILPNKKRHTLNNLVVKCLEAFYYNEEIRNKIIHYASDAVDSMENDDVNKEIKAKFDDIKETLKVQDFYSQQFASLMAEGEDMSDDMLERVNNKVQNEGDFTPTTTKSGSTMLMLSDNAKSSEQPDKSKDLNDYATRREIVELNTKLDTLLQLYPSMVRQGTPVMPAYAYPQMVGVVPTMQQVPTQVPTQMPTETPSEGREVTKESVKKENSVTETPKEINKSVKNSSEEDNVFDGFADEQETDNSQDMLFLDSLLASTENLTSEGV